MANEQYIDPGKTGPFYNLPDKSQLMISASPWGSLKDWGTHTNSSGKFGRTILQANRTMQQFGFSSTVPTAARTSIIIQDTFGFQQSPSPYYFGELFFIPGFKTVMKFTSNGTFQRDSLLNTGTYNYSMEQRSGTYTVGYQNDNVGQFGIIPMCAYIYRPSTQTVVGWLWDLSCAAQGNYDWGAGPSASYMVTGARAIRYYVSTLFGMNTGASYPTGVIDTARTNASVAFLSGDYLVIEHWWGEYTRAQLVTDVAVVYAEISLNGAGSSTNTSVTNGWENTVPTANSYWKFAPPVGYTQPDPGSGSTGIPKLLDISPAGDGVNLTFDSQVDISASLTLGNPAAGLRVLGATSTSSVIKKLNIKPVPPSTNLGF